jgi:hypothetical protein
MIKAQDKAARLQEWILIEAYKNGQAHQRGACATAEVDPEESERYFVRRHDIYQRYFKLPIDAFLRGAGNGDSVHGHVKARLKSAAILCESVRQLLRNGLIQFPQRAFAKKSQADLLRIYASFIFLTEEGVRKAESLLSAFQARESPDRADGPWAAPSRPKPGNAGSLSAS